MNNSNSETQLNEYKSNLDVLRKRKHQDKLSVMDVNRTLDPHDKWHLDHKGHEAMHAEMVIIIIVTMILAQLLLVLWRRKHFKSYQMATTLGMWIIPQALSLYRLYYRFIIIHGIYTIVTLYMIYLSMQKPLGKNTPRLIYTWFYAIFKISHTLGLIGYSGLLAWFFGLNILLMLPITLIYYFALAFYYALYFGVLNRDVAEICADNICYYNSRPRLETNMKSKKPKSEDSNNFYQNTTNNNSNNIDFETNKSNLERNICAICGERIFQLILHTPDQEAIEKSFRLECGHVFHEFCIRGWCIVGKKQTCPQCKEKVDLQSLFPNPWERLHVMYSKLLDWVRYLIAWQPLITLLIEGINHALHLK